MANAAKPASKSEIVTRIAESTELSRKQVSSVFEALSNEIQLLWYKDLGDGER